MLRTCQHPVVRYSIKNLVAKSKDFQSLQEVVMRPDRSLKRLGEGACSCRCESGGETGHHPHGSEKVFRLFGGEDGSWFIKDEN